MRAEWEIKQRIRGLLVLELNRRVQDASLRLPHKCVHNIRHPLDVRRVVNGEPNPQYNHISQGNPTLGLCFYGSESLEDWPGNTCDEPIDAQRCPYFTPRVSKADLISQFREDLKDATWIQSNLPEVAGLLWVLELAKSPELPWWKRLWFRFLRIRVEPISSIRYLESLVREDQEEAEAAEVYGSVPSDSVGQLQDIF